LPTIEPPMSTDAGKVWLEQFRAEQQKHIAARKAAKRAAKGKLCVKCSSPRFSQTRYCRECLLKNRQTAKAWNDTLRAEALEVYGTICAVCGTDRNLELHHINGDGGEHRLAVCDDHQQTRQSLHDLRKRGWPPIMQTLCRDCHTKAEIESAKSLSNPSAQMPSR